MHMRQWARALSSLSSGSTWQPFTRSRRILRLWFRRQPVRVLAGAVLFTLVSAITMFVVESGANELYGSPWDSLWWALVTMTTTGYGDIVPKSFPGRLVGVLTMFAGLGLVTVLTALVASSFVTESLKEARGLEAIKSHGHVVVAGWNWGGQRVVESLAAMHGNEGVSIVLVNQLPEESVNELLFQFKDMDVRFVRGDFCQEPVLERANVKAARSAVLLADSFSPTGARADERTIIACLAMKQLNPDLYVTGELTDAANGPHLHRAGADEVVVSGEFNAFLLAAATASPGIPQVLRALASYDKPTRLRTVPVPPRFVARSFREAADHLREEGLLAVGVVTEAKVLTLADVLSSESTSVDEFIQRKFEEAGIGFGGTMVTGVQIHPPPDYLLQPEDRLVVIGRERPGRDAG